jgi:hypothetical protein
VATDLSLQDTAGNVSQPVNSVTLNGESLSGEPPLDVQVSSVDSDTAKFTFFANEDYADTAGELASFDIEIAFDADKLEFNTSSFTGPSGFTSQPNLNEGRFILSGFNDSAASDFGGEPDATYNFQDELFTFEMAIIDDSQGSTLSFENVVFGETPIIDSTFDFDPATFAS